MKLKNRSAIDVLSPSELSKSRLGQVKNGDIVLIPPYLLRNLHALRHVNIIMVHEKTNVIADGELKARFWRENIYDPSDYKGLFERIDNLSINKNNEMGIVQAICCAK